MSSLLLITSCKGTVTRQDVTVSSSATSINYTVPDESLIKRLDQPSQNTCWATVATMMWMWKNKREISTPDLLSSLSDPTFLAYFNADQAISSDQKMDFLKSMKLAFEFPASFTLAFLESKLKSYGPIWVTTHEGANQNFSLLHARICYGISGDGTITGTYLNLIDPDGGKNVIERFDTFIKKYENAGSISIQMVHW